MFGRVRFSNVYSTGFGSSILLLFGLLGVSIISARSVDRSCCNRLIGQESIEDEVKEDPSVDKELKEDKHTRKDEEIKKEEEVQVPKYEETKKSHGEAREVHKSEDSPEPLPTRKLMNNESKTYEFRETKTASDSVSTPSAYI